MGCEWIGFCALGDEAQAAWAQAILSVIAIFFAGWLPVRQRSNEHRARMDNYVGLLAYAYDLADDYCKKALQELGNVGASSWNYSEIQKISTTIDRVNPHEVPDWKLIPIFHDAHTALVAFAILIQGIISKARNGYPVMQNDLDILEAHVKTLEICYNEAASIRNALGGQTWMQKFRFWKFDNRVRQIASKSEK